MAHYEENAWHLGKNTIRNLQKSMRLNKHPQEAIIENN